jgi:hypothetical protein
MKNEFPLIFEKVKMHNFFCLRLALAGCLYFSIEIQAQTQSYNPAEVAGYRYVERTIYVKEPVTLEKWVEETQYETKTITESRPVVETEKRERRTVVQKPVTRTTMKEQRTVVQKPVTETRYREREVEETSFEHVTEMRQQQYMVQRPVVETQYRDEQVSVRQRVSEDLIEVRNQTVYRPSTTSQTVLYPVTSVTPIQDPTVRPRMTWLRPGYYFDPNLSQSVWRRRGLHWMQPDTLATTTSYMPSTIEQTVLVPETIQTRRPVEVSRYVDRTETRRVPYEVQRMVSETVSQQVPVTVKRPVVRRSVERVPYTETRYVDVEEVTQIPVTETVYEESVEIEPYEVQVERWKTVTREVEVPKTVRRKVEYEEMREVPKTVIVKIPVDRDGRALSLGEPVSEEELRSSTRISSGFGSTSGATSRIEGEWNNNRKAEDNVRPRSVLVEETSEREDDPPMKPIESKPKGTEADERPTLNEGVRQNENDLKNLTVYRKPSLDLDIRPAPRPAITPHHQKEVLSVER